VLSVFEPTPARTGRRLHVYLEGDGHPRRAARFTPPDPTPSPLMLRLQRLDTERSILLGRPCQHGATPCEPGTWTLGRYGEQVVSALTDALQSWLRRAPAEEVVLIGFSGGGTLAMLLAERVPEVVAVVTLAGNLDVAAWVRHHDYVPLRGSLDPARRPALPPRVLQQHHLAERDETVPPALVRDAIARQPGAAAHLHRGFDHRCCWEDAWPAILSELALALPREASEHQSTAEGEAVHVQIGVPEQGVVGDEGGEVPAELRRHAR
jgi:pimeloyl-ACP methyl ester carboxylesterase